MAVNEDTGTRTRWPEPLTLSANAEVNKVGPLRDLLQTVTNQLSFDPSQCWEFDHSVVDKILNRYTTEHAHSFRFLPAFLGHTTDRGLFEQVVRYLRRVDPHFRLRNMDDLMEHEPPWYQTVSFIVGLKQAEEGQFEISSLFLLQAVNGKVL